LRVHQRSLRSYCAAARTWDTQSGSWPQCASILLEVEAPHEPKLFPTDSETSQIGNWDDGRPLVEMLSWTDKRGSPSPRPSAPRRGRILSRVGGKTWFMGSMGEVRSENSLPVDGEGGRMQRACV
jgi:hypothetical protein